ncbi:glutamate ABC transporter substrate-binding protein [Nocardioides sp.]|uniref:glutamate ABC transporter substrate-binding protein n=1 Tax=Nocardioides sp. TaxID=35761 RepID=UPI0039E6367F
MRIGFALAALAAGLVLAACGYDATEVPTPAAADASLTPAQELSCDNTADSVRSYAPDGTTDGPALQRIKERGRLIVGVSADTYLLGYSNPFTAELEGFDIDIARHVAAAIFGVKDGKADSYLQLRVITAAERVSLLESGEIDMVARNMTINCERWQQVGFSAVYYEAGQKVLLREDLAADYHEPGDLDGHTVCAPTGTTSLDNIRELASAAEVVPATNHTGCLVLFQNGKVDAITGDDAVLAGLAAQDPYAVVPEQEAFTSEPYGLATNASDVDLLRFVNGVLEQMAADGSWQSIYDTWLAPTLGEGTQPTPQYGR